MEHQFVATARTLFEATPGSPQQRSANEWLIAFQTTNDAWHVALQVLQHASQEMGENTQALALPPAVLVVTMQLLRFKVTQAWNSTTLEQRSIVRQTVMKWLTESSRVALGAAYSPALRVACVIVADLVVKMHAHEWPQWHEELQQLNAEQPPTGAMMLLEIYGAIPTLLQAVATRKEELQHHANVFHGHLSEIVRVAHAALASSGAIRESALRCIESWSIGSVSACPELGIDISTLRRSSLLSTLLDTIVSGSEHAAKAAGEIIVDIFTSTPSDPHFLSPNVVEAVVETVAWLQSAQQLLTTSSGTPSTDETTLVRCRAVARIASAIALHHSVAVFSPEGQEFFAAASTSTAPLPLCFLQLMLACTSYPDAEVAQPTLEFWFFLLDGSAHQGVQLQLLSSAFSPDQLGDILSHVVNALIERCRYPTWFVDSQTLPSSTDDEPEVESVTGLRQEVADTVLSLFTKWPTAPATERGASCVQGMAALLRSSADIATLDAALYLLEFTIELFDIDSSDSDDDDDDDLEGDDARLQSSHEGAQLLQQILLDSIQLPRHPLLIRGCTRFFQSLSKSLVLPGEVYVRVASFLYQGLDTLASFSLSAHALLGLSKSIVQYTETEERRELLNMAALNCQQLSPAIPTLAAGDLLEASFRLAEGLNESDFMSFCNAILTPLTQHVSSQDSRLAAESVTRLGRAIGGVASLDRSLALVDQVWPLVANAIAAHGHDSHFRECALRYFSSAVVKNLGTPITRLREVIQYCLQWFPHTVSAPTLQCLSAIVCNSATHQESIVPVAQEIAETTLQGCAHRLQFHPKDDDAANGKRIDGVFSSEQTTELLTPEIIELFALLRHLLRFFPTSLAPSTLLTTVLRLSCLLLNVDHQVQGICDAICDFLLDVCSSERLWGCSPDVGATLAAAAPQILAAILAFFGPKRVHYKQRSLWQFLFQLLHAPRIAAPLKAHFHTTITTLLVDEHALSPALSQEQSQSLAGSIVTTTQRHRFVSLLTQTAKQVEAISTR